MSKTHAQQRPPRSADKLKAERIGSDAERQASNTAASKTNDGMNDGERVGCGQQVGLSGRSDGHSKVGEVEAAQLAIELQRLPGWQEGERGLQKSYRFPDFTAACAFANAVAAVARKLRHPPRLNIDGPSLRVEVASPAVRRGVTGLDLDLAAGLEGVDRSLAMPEAL